MAERAPIFVDAKYTRALRIAVYEIAGVLLLSSLLLDGGRTFRQAAVVLLAYLAMLAVTLVRYPSEPANWHLFVVKHAYLIMFLMVFVIEIFRKH